jgi:RecA/RadA recombinase
MAARRTDPDSLAKAAKSTEGKKRVVRKKRVKPTIPTGLTTMNMALCEDPNYGFKKGSVVNIIGDTHTGKTALALNCLAACSHDSSMKDYNLIYDDAEGAMHFDIPYLFGSKTAKRIQAPHPNRKPKYSRTMEDFLFGLMKMLDSKIPFIWIEDSLDALTSEADLEYVESRKKAWAKGKEHTGTYGMGKAKTMSQLFRECVDRIEQSKSLLVIISQTRANINPASFKEKTRSGGTALDFYAHVIMWLAHVGAINVTRNKKQISIGNRTRASISKNKYTGKSRKISFDTYYDYGIDDTASMVAWLETYGGWKGAVKELGLEDVPTKDISIIKRQQIAKMIEDDGLDGELKEFLVQEWHELEESLRLDRKRRF